MATTENPCQQRWQPDRYFALAGAAFVAYGTIGRSRRRAKRAEGGDAGGTLLTLSLDAIGPHDFSIHISKLSEGLSARAEAWVAGAVKQSDVDNGDRPRLSGFGNELLDEVPPKLPLSRGSTVVSTASGEQGAGVPTLHVNFLFSSPLCYAGSSERLPPLSVHNEYSLVEKAWRHSCSSSSIRLDVSAATVDKFSSMATSLFGSSIEWWHLAAHAGPTGGSIVLEDDDGCAHVQDSNFFASSLCRPPFGALVLSCASERLGQALLEAGSAFVLVTRGSLRDSAARLFTEHFYRHLFAHWGNADDCLAMVLHSPCSSQASSGDALQSPHYHTSCSSSSCADSSRTFEMLSSTIRAAFDAGKEALLRAAAPAIRAEALKLELLEGQHKRLPNAVLGSQLRAEGADDAGSPTGGGYHSSLQTCPWTEYSETGSLEEPCFGPHLCEDFIGRAKELQQLIAHAASRRVVVLHGPEGHGKSALCAEFCRFVAAPGRKFSATRCSATGAAEWRHRLGYISLQEVSSGEQDTAEVVATLVNVAKELRGASCLVVDDAEPSLGWHDSIAIQLLRQFSALGLLLVRRRPLYRLEGSDRWKPVNLELGPLPDQEAARLFLARVHRPLFEVDFTGGATGRASLKYEEVLSRLPSHRALALCSGSPKRIAHLASTVTKELPSLLDVEGDALV